MTEPQETASPVCSANEAGDVYMGFADGREIAAFLQELAAAEAAGLSMASRLREMLPRIRDDALHRRLKTRLEAEEEAESKA